MVSLARFTLPSSSVTMASRAPCTSLAPRTAGVTGTSTAFGGGMAATVLSTYLLLASSSSMASSAPCTSFAPRTGGTTGIPAVWSS
jgi:hypothetical protein